MEKKQAWWQYALSPIYRIGRRLFGGDIALNAMIILSGGVAIVLIGTLFLVGRM